MSRTFTSGDDSISSDYVESETTDSNSDDSSILVHRSKRLRIQNESSTSNSSSETDDTPTFANIRRLSKISKRSG
ncbi:hypothetical protein M0802_012950 [Mischocyttarus mexicanus]|nr:hypothetical protein M0802_012950 [Mischocyttarus mexicanus]